MGSQSFRRNIELQGLLNCRKGDQEAEKLKVRERLKQHLY